MLEGTEAWTGLRRLLESAGEGGMKKGLTLGSSEVDDVSVLLEHVDLLDGLDGLHVHLLQGGLELLVVGAGRLVDLLDLAAGSALASAFVSIVLSTADLDW